MTLPYERRNALKNTREFLLKLLDPKLAPRIPKAIRQEARSCLKHFPNDFDMTYPALEETFGPKPISELCDSGRHEWCANRNPRECGCECGCHSSKDRKNYAVPSE
jgi:hypothetical protein